MGDEVVDLDDERVLDLREELPLGDGRGVGCLLYTSDAADERSSVDLGGRRIIKKKNSTLRERSGGSLTRKY